MSLNIFNKDCPALLTFARFKSDSKSPSYTVHSKIFVLCCRRFSIIVSYFSWIEAIKSKTEALVQSSLKLGEAIYKQNPQAGAAQPDPSGEEPSSDKKDEKVVDAEFEEVDENKKD